MPKFALPPESIKIFGEIKLNHQTKVDHSDENSENTLALVWQFCFASRASESLPAPKVCLPIGHSHQAWILSPSRKCLKLGK